MTSFLSSLIASKGGVVLTDGGWGTQLQRRGLPLGAHPDLWNLSHADAVEAVAADYVAAGSDVILTNTFGGNRLILERHGGVDKLLEINRAGVAISRRAAAGRAKVFASMGPSGAMLMTGAVTEDELYSVFCEQATAIAAESPDAIVVETMSDPAEAAIAVRAAKTMGLPVVACMVFDAGKDRDRTMMGTTPEQVVTVLTEAGADVIGANCGQGIDGFIPICRRMRAVTPLPLWMKANAGLPRIVEGQTVYDQTPEAFAAKIDDLVAAGATFVGGCCGTSPAFIAAISRQRDTNRRNCS